MPTEVPEVKPLNLMCEMLHTMNYFLVGGTLVRAVSYLYYPCNDELLYVESSSSNLYYIVSSKDIKILPEGDQEGARLIWELKKQD